jgi:hypothetical protein
MSEKREQIDRHAVDLLLMVLEQPKLIVTAAAIELLGQHRAAPLIQAGLLKSIDHERTTTATDDHDDTPITLTWSPEHGGYGYFSPTAGWITVRSEETTRYSVDMPVLFARLMLNMEVSSRGDPTPLLPNLLWGIGDVRLGRRTQRVPIWYARRLHAPSVLQQVKDAAKARPPSQLRILLTSTPSRRLPAESLPGHIIVAIGDVIDFDAGICVDPGILAARLAHGCDDGQPVSMAADGASITVRGKTYPFTGTKQRAIIRHLFEAWRRGERECLTAAVLEAADSGAQVRTLAKAFKPRTDWREFIKEEHGRC